MSYPRNSTEGIGDEPVQGDQLRSLVERIERLEEEGKAINQDKAEVYAEAKANGYDTKIMRKVIAIRRRDPNERKEEEAVLDLYLQAVGENKDEAPIQRAQKQRVGAEPKNQLAPGIEMTVTVAGTGSRFEQAVTTAAENIGAKVERAKPLVGSFTPPAEKPPEDAFGD